VVGFSTFIPFILLFKLYGILAIVVLLGGRCPCDRERRHALLFWGSWLETVLARHKNSFRVDR